MMEITEQMINEAFDTPSESAYPAINMKPGSGSPQIFLIQNESTENLIVRMMALSGDGDKLRVLKPTDKNVIVELMSINDRGRHIVLQNGIGANPIKTIISIFDTVYSNLNLTTVESIMFRFQTKKMKGQARSIIRILERLVVTRGKGKFAVLKEMEKFTNKFSYVVLYKRKLELEKLPGAGNIDDKYEKVETKVGEVYVDTKTGQQVSKSDVIADSIATTIDKISNKDFAMKTKISRLDLMSTQYSSNDVYAQGSAQLAKYETIISKQVATPTTNETTGSAANKLVEAYDKNKDEFLRDSSERLTKAIEYDDLNHLEYVDKTIFRQMLSCEKSDGSLYTKEEVENFVKLYTVKIYFMKPSTIQSTINEMIEYILSLDMNHNNKKNLCVSVINRLTRYSQKLSINVFEEIKNHDFDSAQRSAIIDYCGSSYREINNYLIGSEEASAATLNKIEKLDDAFIENGTKLEKGIKLYRGMKVIPVVFDRILSTKMFYFKNYVSTTVAPMIFNGSGFSSVLDNAIHPVSSELDDTMSHLTTKMSVDMGMVISGADKIKTIIPGSLSPYSNEVEVMLPRGTVVKFDDIIRSKNENDNDITSSILAYTTIVDPTTLTESDIVYDGDVFFESGELVVAEPENKFSFSNFQKKLEIENMAMALEVKEMLASICGLNELPTKMI